MKLSGTMIGSAVGGLLLAASAQAINSDGGNPYQSIVDRNVFALRPPPDPETTKPQAPPPPPIELQGITSMFGRQQVLFSATVAGSKPGEPPKKSGMVLKVGERQDDIEVLEINEAAGSVKFNNHGTEEVKYLEKDSTKIVTAPMVATFPGVAAGKPMPPQIHSGLAAVNSSALPGNAGGGTTIGSAGSTLRNIPSRTLRGPTTGQTQGTLPPNPQANRPALSPEEQLIHMEILKAKTQMEQNSGQFTPPAPPQPPLPPSLTQ